MNVKLSRNADGTLSVRVGRAVEHIDPAFKSKSQVFDAVKYAVISKGGRLSDIQITEELHRLEAA